MKFRATEGFDKAYYLLQSPIQAKVDKAVRLLVSNPRHPSLHLKKMRASGGLWEARVDRNYRITLEIEGDCFVMRNVGKHDETLDNP